MIKSKPTRAFNVTVRYRTNSKCDSKMVMVKAPDLATAVQIACDKIRRRRGVIRIDGGHCVDWSRS
jgi:hypothetical protein